MSKTFKCAAAIGLLVLIYGGAGFSQQSSSPAMELAPTLRIAAGDLIEVTVFGEPDLSGHFRVDEKGEIGVPLLGPVAVGGKTAEETAAALDQRYVQAEILNSDRAYVTVLISEYATQGIVVTGDVKAPGVFPALGIRMLSDIMTAAGGLNVTASTKITINHKNAPETAVTVEYNPDTATPVIPQIQILPGDTINVPRAGVVYAAGNVSRAGAYVLDGSRMLTVEKLMAIAGGGGRGAAMNRVHLVRTLQDGRREDIQISVNEIFNGKSPDVAMKDGDILYIPTSRAKIVTAQAISSALGIGTSFAIYRVANQ